MKTLPWRQNHIRRVLLAVSGGMDSVYLLHLLAGSRGGDQCAVGHVNHGFRGKSSESDRKFVERLTEKLGVPCQVRKAERETGRGKNTTDAETVSKPGLEAVARRTRYRLLQDMKRDLGADRILTAHTADDQVETILMRFFEGAGISGLKGIPRETEEGIVRPILDVWREDIDKYMKKYSVPYRVDRSNLDVRFERNWIRHILIPLLVNRYGDGVKRRIFTLGERFRELDCYLESESYRWIHRNVKFNQRTVGGENIKGKFHSKTTKYPRRNRPSENGNSPRNNGMFRFPREGFSRLPTALRVKIVQRICFDQLGLVPNERLLTAMDRVVRDGGPSAKLNIGKGWKLINQYGYAAFVRGESRGVSDSWELYVKREEKGRYAPAWGKRTTGSGITESFDASGIRMPLRVRPLQTGDRIRPFGLDAEKKVKEILMDRKVPREDRWGRPAVCDADGKILWIPGLVRSAHAPVMVDTKEIVLLKLLRDRRFS